MKTLRKILLAASQLALLAVAALWSQQQALAGVGVGLVGCLCLYAGLPDLAE